MNKMFDAMTSNRKPIWQALGTTFVTNITATDALREIDGDFEIIKAQTYASFKGHPVKLDGDFELMRKLGGGYRKFGRCASAYEIVQRKEFASIIDDLTVRWPLETAGQLNDGQTFFCMLNAGQIEIKKDLMTMYFLIVDTADGGTSAKAMFTSLRMHCWNALLTSIKRAVVNMSMNHRRGIHRDLRFTIELAGKMAEAQNVTMQQFEWMANKILTPEQVVRIYSSTYPMPKRPAKMEILDIVPEDNEELADIRAGGLDAAYAYQYYTDTATAMRAAATGLLERFNDEQPTLANTGWAVYNAAVELADWRAGSESAYVDALFGRRAKEKRLAFTSVMREI
jgi:hypothetical protein